MQVKLIALLIVLMASPSLAARRRLSTCNISTNGRCGSQGNNTYCGIGSSCSRYSWCGVGSAWEAHSANSHYNGSATCVLQLSIPHTRVVQIKNLHSNKVLDVTGGHFNQGSKLIQWGANGGDNQKFQLVYLNATEFNIVPMKGQQLSAQIMSNNDAVLDHRDDSPDAIFHMDGDAVKSRDGKCLSVRGGSSSRGAQVTTWECHGNADQKWQFINQD